MNTPFLHMRCNRSQLARTRVCGQLDREMGNLGMTTTEEEAIVSFLKTRTDTK
jgi:hypothetical protein